MIDWDDPKTLASYRGRSELERRVRRIHDAEGMDAVLTDLHQWIENQRRLAADSTLCAVFDSERARGNDDLLLTRLAEMREQLARGELPGIAEGVVRPWR